MQPTTTRTPDPVRDALVRTAVAVSVTLVLVMITVLNAAAGSWAWVLNTVLVTLAVLACVWCGADIVVARQTASGERGREQRTAERARTR